MFYDAHFTIDVTNWSQGIRLDGTTQIMDRENILLSDRFVPAYLPEFPDDRRSANEALASMVGAAKVYDRIFTLADEHGLHVDEDEFSTLIVSSGGATIGTVAVAMSRSGAKLDVDPFCGGDVSKRPIWDHFVDDLTNDPVIEHSRTPVSSAARLVDDFILCLEEMRDSDRCSATWECARSDARDRLTDLCNLVGIPAEQVIGFDI
ncbi:hypothetical protein [Prevotella denticola]